MEYKDYYKTLGVAKTASSDEIKHAYRRLARKYHPDVSKESNAEEQFKNVQEAYEVLKDKEKREAYDQLGSNWQQGQDFRPPPNWDAGMHSHSQQRRSHQFSESDMGQFSDFFSELFGGRGRRQAADESFAGFEQRGQDQHAKVTITLEEAFQGATKMLQLSMPEMDVTGQVHPIVRTLKVTIPAGAVEGQQLRLAKQGGAGMGGAAAGDLYLEIAIQPHAFYTLQGHDIYITLPVTPWEAALGAEIKIPTLGGPVGLKLPAGSESGKKLRLKGRGMPSKKQVGDQYAIVQIDVPVAKTDEQRQLYEKMAQTMPFNPRQYWKL